MPSTEAVAPRDGRRTDTRERLVTAALKLFGEKGYTGTTIAEIEKVVGLRPGGGGLYRHFASKDELLLESVGAYHDRVKHVRAELARRRGASTAEPPSREAVVDDLRHLVSTLAEFLAGEGAMVRLRLDAGGLPEAVRQALGGAWDDGYGMLADLFIHHGIDAARAPLLAVRALGALDHYFSHVGMWHRLPAGIDAATFVDAWIDGCADEVVPA